MRRLSRIILVSLWFEFKSVQTDKCTVLEETSNSDIRCWYCYCCCVCCDSVNIVNDFNPVRIQAQLHFGTRRRSSVVVIGSDWIRFDLIWFDWRQSIALFWLVEQWIWYSEETGTLLGNFRRKVGKSVKNAEISAIVLHLYRINSYEKVWKFKIEER